MPWSEPSGGGGGVAAALGASLITRRNLFINALGSSGNAVSSFSWMGISPWANGEAFVPATVNRIGRMTDLRGKVTPLVSPNAAFGFGAGSVLGAFRSPTGDGRIWCRVNDGGTRSLAFSDDEGVTWGRITGATIGLTALMSAMTQASSGRLWVSQTNDTLWFSDNNGVNWTSTNPGLVSGGGRFAVQPSPDGSVAAWGTNDDLAHTNNIGTPPVWTIINVAGIPITPHYFCFSTQSSRCFIYSNTGEYGFTDDFITFTAIPDSINPLIRGNSAGASIFAIAVYSEFYQGFFVYSSNSIGMAFFPESDMLNPVTIPVNDASTANEIAIDETGYILIPAVNVANAAMASLNTGFLPLV